jgi:hypothetical protein
MEDDPLPIELEEIEARLAALPRSGPGAALRLRVLGDFDRQLGHGAWLWYAAAAAAMVVLWLNLSWSASRATSFEITRRHDAIDRQARQIREVMPELSEPEAYRHAIVLNSGRRLSAVSVAGQRVPEAGQRNAF